MNLRWLQSFVAVVDYESFTLAGKHTFTSQPTISAHIKSLEDELGVQLFERTTKSLKTTRKGMELYECAKSMLKLYDQLHDRWRQEHAHILHIGASTIPASYILPEVLSAYKQYRNDVYFTIHQADSEAIYQGLEQGLYDIGLVGMLEEHAEIQVQPFCHDTLVIITPVNETLLQATQDTSFDIRELFEMPVILREEGSGTKRRSELLLDDLGLKESNLTIAARINDQESIKHLVESGLGISIISKMAAQNFIDTHRVLAFETPFSTANRNLYLLLPTRNKPKAITEHFAQFLTSRYDIST